MSSSRIFLCDASRRSLTRCAEASLLLLAFVFGIGVESLRADKTGSLRKSPGERDWVREVQTAQRQAEQDAELTPEQRKHLGDVYREALDELQQAEQWRAKTRQFDAERRDAPQELTKLRDRMAGAVDEPLPVVLPTADPDSVRRSWSQAEARLKTAREQQAEIETRQHFRTDRRDAVRTLDDEASHRETEIAAKLEALPDDASGSSASRAERLLYETRRVRLSAERAAYAAELPSYEATRDLLRLRLDEAVHQTNTAEKIVGVWKEAVERLEAGEAERQARDAQSALITARPETLSLAQENERLTQLRQGESSPGARLKRVRQSVAASAAQAKRIRGEFERVRQAAGLSTELGQLLLNERKNLPNVKSLEESIAARNAELARIKLELFTLETERSELADLDAATTRTLEPLAGAVDSAEQVDLETAVHDLLSARRGYLDDLIGDYDSLFNAMVLEQDKTEQELLQVVRSYCTYIDEQILWVRSYPATTGCSPTEWLSATRRLCAIDDWASLGGRWWFDLQSSPQTWCFAALGYALLWATVKRSRRLIAQIGRTTSKSYTAGFLPTLYVAGLTVWCALPAPALLWFLAARLVAWPGTTEFVRAFADAACITAAVWFTLALVRQVLRRDGLAEAHFGYARSLLDGGRKMLWKLAAVGLPATAIAALCDGLQHVPLQGSYGRAALVLGMFCLARAVRVVTHPTNGLLHLERCDEKETTEPRMARLWYLAARFAVLSPAVLSIVGYHYTALQLVVRLQATVWALVGFWLLRSLLVRGLLVARRRFTWEQAHRHRLPQADAATTEKPQLPQPCLATIDRQSHRLVNSFGALAFASCLWWIWVDMLPALQFLDHRPLYSYSVTIHETSVQNDGTTKDVEHVRLQWITAADLVWAVVILAMAVVAVRNLPGLLELTCLKWLPLDPGARYAATTIVRYLIHLTTIIAVCNVVGLQWSSVQWLAAAATVGLGFGLQEIFANFISGLIILFERPIRVGDTVTIGNVTGAVTRIRGRATTIVDDDRKELIVPNKEFITGQLINWTLSDDLLRTVIRIGINHGSDVQLAGSLLLDAAHANPSVLAEPAPSVACTQLGDHQLTFELRVFSSGAAGLEALRHQLNVAILTAFEKAGITIASSPHEVVLRGVESQLAAMTHGERKVA